MISFCIPQTVTKQPQCAGHCPRATAALPQPPWRCDGPAWVSYLMAVPQFPHLENGLIIAATPHGVASRHAQNTRHVGHGESSCNYSHRRRVQGGGVSLAHRDTEVSQPGGRRTQAQSPSNHVLGPPPSRLDVFIQTPCRLPLPPPTHGAPSVSTTQFPEHAALKGTRRYAGVTMLRLLR